MRTVNTINIQFPQRIGSGEVGGTGALLTLQVPGKRSCSREAAAGWAVLWEGRPGSMGTPTLGLAPYRPGRVSPAQSKAAPPTCNEWCAWLSGYPPPPPPTGPVDVSLLLLQERGRLVWTLL